MRYLFRNITGWLIKKCVLHLSLILLNVLILAGCKKNFSENNPAANPGNIPPDLGSYTATEEGPDLMSNTPDTSHFTGYTDKRSYSAGDTVKLFFSGPAGNRQLGLYNINFKKVFDVNTTVIQQKITTEKPWLNGFGYAESGRFILSDKIKSGIYRWMNTTAFIVKSKIPRDITVVYPTNTINAYCTGGGKSLYRPVNSRAFVASFLRDQYYNSRSYSTGFLQWMEKQSYDVNYLADEDLDDYGNLENSRLLIIIGHSEYWTRKARENFDKFVESGKNALVLSGNAMWWQVRYNKEKNVMICYKGSPLDPLANTPFDTRNWFSSFLNYPIISSIGNDFTYAGYGKENDSSKISDAYNITEANSPLFSGTNLKNGDTLNFPQNELDGTLLVNRNHSSLNELPAIDKQKLNFFKIELLAYINAYDKDFPQYRPGTATFIVFKKSASSGTIVNTGSETWGDRGFTGPSNDVVEKITKNMIDKSLSGESLFTN